MPFLAWLAARPEQTIAVVCHHNTIQHFIGVRDRLLGKRKVGNEAAHSGAVVAEGWICA